MSLAPFLILAGGVASASVFLLKGVLGVKKARLVLDNGALVIFRGGLVVTRDLLRRAGIDPEILRFVSRRHLEIFWREGGYKIVDLGSLNGTYLNGVRLKCMRAYPLNDGDVISIGRVVRARFYLG